MTQKIQPSLSARQTLLRLLRDYTFRYKGAIGGALACMALAAATQASLAKLIQPVIDDVFVRKDLDSLMTISFLTFVVFFTKGIAAYGETVLMSFVGQRIISDIQIQLMRHLTRLDLVFFQKNASGKLIARCTNDVALMRSTVSSTLTSMGKDLIMVVCLLGVLFYQNTQLAFLAIFVFPVAIYPLARIGKKMRKVTISTQNEVAEYTTLLNQVFQGSRVVKAYAMENYECQRTEDIVTRIMRLIHKGNRVRAVSRPLMEFLGGFAIVSIILYGGYEVIEGANTAGSFFSFITAFLLAYEPVKRLANLNANIQEGIAAAHRVFEILDQKPAIFDAPQAQALTHEQAQGDIRLENVSFDYDNQVTVLKNIHLHIPTGSTIALVGASGSGKSTLLNLIPRFFEVTAGQVTIGGQDVRSVTLDSLRHAIALVSQEVMLFDDTIRANIAYGKQEATEAEIIAAAQAAAAHDFIMELPQGYDTVVGEHGTKLSGGQRQRVSIARAIIKDAPILLLDEATAALDTESEHKVQYALDNLMKGKTVIVIAHRLSTIRNAQAIHVLERGEIVESGTHESLLAQSGHYAKFYHMQFRDGNHGQEIS